MTERQAFAKAKAIELMEQFGIPNWTFRFTKSRRRTGLTRCRHPSEPGTIEMSQFLPELNGDEVVIDTILHEISHALAYIRHGETGHGPAWKAVCIEIGAKPERIGHDMVVPTGGWQGSCPLCERKFTIYRRPDAKRQYFCETCGIGPGNFTWIKTQT